MSALIRYTRLSNLIKLSSFNRSPNLAYSHIRTGIHSYKTQCAISISETLRVLPPRQVVLSSCSHSTGPPVVSKLTNASTPTPSRGPPPPVDSNAVYQTKPPQTLLDMVHTNNRRIPLRIMDFRNAINRAFKQGKTAIQDAELLMVITSSPSLSLSASEKLKILDKLWQHYKDTGVHPDLALFNARFAAYDQVDALDQLSVIEILTDMEKCEVSPNHTSYSMFLKMYCAVGDMPSASEVLQHMKGMSMAVNTHHYNNLIHGHFVAGDRETAVGLFNSMGERQLIVNSFSHGEMLLGYSRLGDIESVGRMLKEPFINNVPRTLLEQSIILLDQQGQHEMAETLLQRYIENALGVNSRSTLINFLDAGLVKFAVTLFLQMKSELPVFVICAAASNVNEDRFIECILDVCDQSSSLQKDLFFAWGAVKHLDKPDRLVDLLSVMKVTGCDARPELFMGPLNRYKEKNDVSGLCQKIQIILQHSTSPKDMESLVQMLFQTFLDMGKSITNTVALLQKHTPKNLLADVNFHLLLPFVYRDIQGAIKFVGAIDALSINKESNFALNRMLISEFLPNHWKDVFQLLLAIRKKTSCDYYWVLERTAQLLQRDSMDVMPFVNFLIANNMKVGERSKFDALFPELATELKVKLRPKARHSIQQKPRTVDGLTTVRELFEAVEKKDVDEVSRCEEELQAKNFKIRNPWLTIKLLNYHAFQRNDPETALKYLLSFHSIKGNPRNEGNSRNEGLFAKFTAVLHVAGLFAQDGMIDRAIETLNSTNVAGQFITLTKASRTDFASVILLCENEQQLSNLILSVFENGYGVSVEITDFIWQCFFENVIERGDIDELGRAIDFMHDHPTSKNLYVLHTVFKMLIEQSNQTYVSLVGQKVKQHLKQAGDELCDVLILNMLVTSFLDNGNEEILPSIVQTRGFVAHLDYISWYSRYCGITGQAHRMETLYDVLKDDRSVDKEDLLFECIRAYFHARPVQIKEASRVMTSKYTKERVPISSRTRNYFERRQANVTNRTDANPNVSKSTKNRSDVMHQAQDPVNRRQSNKR